MAGRPARRNGDAHRRTVRGRSGTLDDRAATRSTGRWGGTRAPRPAPGVVREQRHRRQCREGGEASSHQRVPGTATAVLGDGDTQRGDAQTMDDVRRPDGDRRPAGVAHPGMEPGIRQDPLVDQAAAFAWQQLIQRVPGDRDSFPVGQRSCVSDLAELQPRRRRWLGRSRRTQQRWVTAQAPTTIRQVRCRPRTEPDRLAATGRQQIGLELLDGPLPPGVGERCSSSAPLYGPAEFPDPRSRTRRDARPARQSGQRDS
jgi:hypothetical protein